MAAICVPEELCCAITHELMRDPVVTTQGQTYERAAIETYWQAGVVRDPLTNMAVLDTTLMSNFTVRRMVQRFLDENPEYTVEEWPTRELAPARPPAAVEIPVVQPASATTATVRSVDLSRNCPRGRLALERRSGATIRADDSVKRILFDGLGAFTFIFVVMLVLSRFATTAAVPDCGHCLVRAPLAKESLPWLHSNGRCHAVEGSCVLRTSGEGCVDTSGYVCLPKSDSSASDEPSLAL